MIFCRERPRLHLRESVVARPVMLLRFRVASTKRCEDAGSPNSGTYLGERGRGNATGDRGPEPGECWMGH